jgi:exodeoxyribonuclease III
MKIITFNVNGIRSALSKGLSEWFESQSPDIMCLQEIKLSETELVEPIFTALGYHCHWYPAEKKGYSGVAIISKTKPLSVVYGCGIDQYDSEGRTILADFKAFKILCAYFPSGSSGDARQEIKIRFLNDIFTFVQKIKKETPNLIVCGDINICHQAIDIHNPKSNANTSGFLPEEREWLSKFLEHGFIDCFRHINKEPHNYSWWSYRAGARGKNLGWRIDYVFATNELGNNIKDAKIHADVVMSDHCPVSVSLEF